MTTARTLNDTNNDTPPTAQPHQGTGFSPDAVARSITTANGAAPAAADDGISRESFSSISEDTAYSYHHHHDEQQQLALVDGGGNSNGERGGKMSPKKRRDRTNSSGKRRHHHHHSYEYSAPPPPKLRRLVASCWLGPGQHGSANKSITSSNNSNHNWLEITKCPPSSGSYLYDEHYAEEEDDGDYLASHNKSSSLLGGGAPLLKIDAPITAKQEAVVSSTGAHRQVRGVPRTITTGLFRPAARGRSSVLHEHRMLLGGGGGNYNSNHTTSPLILQVPKKDAPKPPPPLEDLKQPHHQDISESMDKMEVEEEHELLNMEMFSDGGKDESSEREMELVTPSPNVLLQQIYQNSSSGGVGGGTTPKDIDTAGATRSFVQEPLCRPTPLRRSSAMVVVPVSPPKQQQQQQQHRKSDSNVLYTAATVGPTSYSNSITTPTKAQRMEEDDAVIHKPSSFAKSNDTLEAAHKMMQQLIPSTPVSSPVRPVKHQRADFFDEPIESKTSKGYGESLFFQGSGQYASTSPRPSTTPPFVASHQDRQVEYPLNFPDGANANDDDDDESVAFAALTRGHTFRPSSSATKSNSTTTSSGFQYPAPAKCYHPQPHIMFPSPVRRSQSSSLFPPPELRTMQSAFAPGRPPVEHQSDDGGDDIHAWNNHHLAGIGARSSSSY